MKKSSIANSALIQASGKLQKESKIRKAIILLGLIIPKTPFQYFILSKQLSYKN
jgi:hypothetical protein